MRAPRKHHSELARHDWHTPAEIVEAAREVLGALDLNPASCERANETVRAARFYSPKQDGLKRPWFGRLWMNPPYGRFIALWVARLVHEYEKGNVTEAVALLPARVDTAWFARLDAYPRCHIRGRLKFNNVENGAPFPSAVFYFGPDPEHFRAVFGRFGKVWR